MFRFFNEDSFISRNKNTLVFGGLAFTKALCDNYWLFTNLDFTDADDSDHIWSKRFFLVTQLITGTAQGIAPGLILDRGLALLERLVNPETAVLAEQNPYSYQGQRPPGGLGY